MLPKHDRESHARSLKVSCMVLRSPQWPSTCTRVALTLRFPKLPLLAAAAGSARGAGSRGAGSRGAGAVQLRGRMNFGSTPDSKSPSSNATSYRPSASGEEAIKPLYHFVRALPYLAAENLASTCCPKHHICGMERDDCMVRRRESADFCPSADCPFAGCPSG